MNSAQAKLKKILSLQLDEIQFRCKEKLRTKHEWLQYQLGFRISFRKNVQFQAHHDRFLLDTCKKAVRKELLERHGHTHKAIQDAEGILQGTVNLLGIEMAIPSGQGWHRDPLIGREWPRLFYSKVRHHHSVQHLDIKHVWEINRHQFLIHLAKAYWCTGDDKYARAVFGIITDWIDANPYHTGVNWTSSLELAVRLLSWIWSLSFCKTSIHYKENIDKIKESVYQQTSHIANHLSIYSSPYNHLIGEAAALFCVGSLFPDMARAAEWEELGYELLEKTIDSQFHPDGMSVEQAFFYHHFSLGFYLTCFLLRRMNGKTVSDHVWQRVGKAAEISFHLAMPDGTLPMKGDVDNARSICFNLDHTWDFSFFYDLAAVLFDRPELKSRHGRVPEELIWLLSDEDLKKYQSMTPERPSQMTRLFERSGYWVCRDSWEQDANYVCFDCGEISHGLSQGEIASAAHGHADALSLDLCALGRPFLVDCGLFTYFGDEEWHRSFRQEEAHNTFSILGFRQAEYAGRLKWRKAKNVEVVSCRDSGSLSSCAARLLLGPEVSAVREISYHKPSFWVVQDKVESESDHEVEAYFNFHPDVFVSLNSSEQEIKAVNQEAGLVIKFLRDVDIKDTTGDDSPSGWVCRGYGMRQRCCSVTVKWPAHGTAKTLPFVMVPFPAHLEKPVVEYDPQELTWRVQTGGETFCIDLDEDSHLSPASGLGMEHA